MRKEAESHLPYPSHILFKSNSANIRRNAFQPNLYFARASFGGLSRPSTPCLPMLGSTLSVVAGSRSPLSLALPTLISSCFDPDPRLTVLGSAEFQSEATGGSSGSGRLA